MQVGGGAKSGPSEGGRGRRNRMIGQMVTEIVSEAKAAHFAGLVPVILPLLDGGSSQRNGTTGDPNESPHPVVNRTLQVACMQNACGKLLMHIYAAKKAAKSQTHSVTPAGRSIAANRRCHCLLVGGS